jgi:hypothetical protein
MNIRPNYDFVVTHLTRLRIMTFLSTVMLRVMMKFWRIQHLFCAQNMRIKAAAGGVLTVCKINYIGAQLRCEKYISTGVSSYFEPKLWAMKKRNL